VFQQFIDVSEECTSSTFRAKEKAKQAVYLA
jgi:hypothetical protein